MTEVRADVAYQAARERALRTTEALILAEAEKLDLLARLDQALREIQALDDRLAELEGGREGDAASESHEAVADSAPHTAYAFSD